MIDLTKQYEFFKPELVDKRVHIIGCGSVGSTIAENLVRCGISNLTLYDFDKVEAHNITNQMFRYGDIGSLKVDALKEILVEIDPAAKSTIKTNSSGWNGEMLSGYVFLACDSIEVRKKFVEEQKNNMTIKAVFDIRTMITGAQHYAADWRNIKMKEDLLESMNFTHEEARVETPVSACGVTLGIVTTVRLISALAINNLINFVKGNNIWKFVQIDGFKAWLDCF